MAALVDCCDAGAGEEALLLGWELATPPISCWSKIAGDESRLAIEPWLAISLLSSAGALVENRVPSELRFATSILIGSAEVADRPRAFGRLMGRFNVVPGNGAAAWMLTSTPLAASSIIFLACSLASVVVAAISLIACC